MARDQPKSRDLPAKRRRGGKEWTTEDERVWLVKKMKTYNLLQQLPGSSNLGKFWTETQRDFRFAFRKDVELSPKSKKLLNESGTQPKPTQRVLKLDGKKKRRLTGQHAYSALYYRKKVASVVAERWRVEEEYDPEHPDPPLKFQ
ncbi:hypothetical protein ONZ45_g7243 [Pleurotus djamor]|nr:hypothetical protein ONZ45_g7243 [Pleurotus djamor]